MRGVILEIKSGRQAILCEVCVDATGDGDVAYFAGADFDLSHQRIGLNLKIGNIDREGFQRYREKNSAEYTKTLSELRASGGFPISPNTTPHSDTGVYWVNVVGLAGRDDLGAESGSSHQIFDGTLSSLDVEDLTYAEVEMRKRLAFSLECYKKNVPGFESVRLLSFAPQLGVRKAEE